MLICLCIANALAYPEEPLVIEPKPEVPIKGVPMKLVEIKPNPPIRSIEPLANEEQLNDGGDESLEPAASAWGHGYGRNYGWGGYRSYGGYGGWGGGYSRSYYRPHGGYYSRYRSYW
ncbi:uncharacterized protein LOC116350603 isoform X2 [Contarinia nasturtii]|nr:uncharacterized protein LOC116350603 isoform X2 [Contarinia nasturtii]